MPKTSVSIRKCRRSDNAVLELMFEDFADFLASVDDLDRLARRSALAKAGYGRMYLKMTLKDVSENGGAFYVAEDGRRRIVGFIALATRKLSEVQRTELKRRQKFGEVTELYVRPEYRGKGLATSLMDKAEHYLMGKGCNCITIKVFAPNAIARGFYEKFGYRERGIELIKEFKHG